MSTNCIKKKERNEGLHVCMWWDLLSGHYWATAEVIQVTLRKRKLEVALPAKPPIRNQCGHIWTTRCEHYRNILHEINLSVSIHFPHPCPKNIPLNMTFPVRSFSHEIKERKSHRKSTYIQPVKHVWEQQHGRTNIPDGPWEGYDAGMGLRQGGTDYGASP